MYQFDADGWTRRLFATVPRLFSFNATDKEGFLKWQEQFRPRLREILGLHIIEELGRTELDAKLEDQVELDDYMREKWWITTEPGFHLPFYLLKPKEAGDPRPLVITVHGHGGSGKQIYAGIYTNEEERKSITEGERDIAVQAVREGYIAIAPDMRAFGELKRPEDQARQRGFCRTLQMHTQLFGRCLVGDRVWDVGRLIDFACTRPDIDSSRVAITGNSGGGTVSLFAAAADTRISVAAPSCYFCTFEDSIGSIHHCECNYIPGVARLGEMSDVAGLIAPRPFLAIAGRDDAIFPKFAVEKSFQRVKKIYQVAGAPDRCELYIGEGGHRYYKDGAWPFMRKWL